MKIEVTADHVRSGRRGDPYACPIALALIDAGVSFPCVCHARGERGTRSRWAPTVRFGGRVGATGARVGQGSFPLPRAAAEWAIRFDDRDRVEPFAFDAPVPGETNR